MFVVLAVAACSTDRVTIDEQPVERVILFDLDGKQWDVTQAVLRYGFEKDGFLFGLGAFSVPPLVDPTMAAVSEAGFPAADSVFDVAGIGVNSDYRAYGIFDLAGYEVVDDAAGSRAVAVVIQPLLGTVDAWARTTETTTLTLSASGWLYGDRSILFDLVTESLWYQLDGTSELTCINGTFLGNTLEPIPVTRTTWSSWYMVHPTTRVLIPPQP